MTNELVIVTNVISREITGLDVVNSVNGYYSGAFDKLFQLVLALFALFGVILPILIAVYQRQLMKARETELKNELTAEMFKLLEAKKSELVVEFEKKFNSEKAVINKSLQENVEFIDKRLNDANGGVFHVQGNTNSAAGRYFSACEDFCKAGTLYAKSKSGRDLAAVMENLTGQVSAKVNKNDLENRGLLNNIQQLIEQIQQMDDGNFLGREIEKLKEAIESAKAR